MNLNLCKLAVITLLISANSLLAGQHEKNEKGAGKHEPEGKHEHHHHHEDKAITAAAPQVEKPVPSLTAPPKAHGKAAQENAAAEAMLLQKAYSLLFHADHDYHGHRILAMEATARSARCFGVVLSGDGHAGEAQGFSDAQLREARGVLLQARVQLLRLGRQHAADCASHAVTEIDIALKFA